MTITNEMLEQGLNELTKLVHSLEERQLMLSVLNTYICDKNGYDMNAIITLLFSNDKNIEIIRQNLTDPNDELVLDRLVNKFLAKIPPKKEYNH